ncbi:uncharacterized protein BCR38DRAFT_478154 [Pseudomassariella vexata]|uniref:Uncharacterized protein n=1 Tax=Pseudomassariella vexata TaxID=1141098 RepID=A0A1Y2DGP4_9PEZI|nr:uncharacterized protein BCR38DRAFT_478154 [Pseudomassariella vexata]ORY57865.1 hypothetical protein BCR38DRAFT_478154 [Pseudomassariella vexata]
MRSSHIATISYVAALAEACTQCVHPGNFTGAVSLYWNTTKICVETLPNIAASIPASFWTPHDEAPCAMAITVTNPNTGKNVVATVVSQETDAVGDAIQLTTAGLAALAPDADPNHAPATVDWTFNG